MGMAKAKSDKVLRKWCKENFINSRSLKYALDIHRHIWGHVEQMGLHVSSCRDNMLQYRRCLAASFLLIASVKQPRGIYMYSIYCNLCLRNYLASPSKCHCLLFPLTRTRLWQVVRWCRYTLLLYCS